MILWLHRLFNPHCPHCQEERQENRICQSCETLKMQLAIANHEKEHLLSVILESTKQAQAEASPQIDYEKVKPKLMTWNVRRQMLEAEDRKAAQILAEQKKSVSQQIADLEKEVGLENSKEAKSNA